MDRREFLQGIAVASLLPACSGVKATSATLPNTVLPSEIEPRKIEKPIVILGAMPQEVEHYRTFLQDIQDVQEMVTGKWGNHQVYVGLTGIGISDAAAKTQQVIERYDPRIIIFTGVAGSLDERVGIGDLAIIHAAINYEMDVRGFDSSYLLGQHLFEKPESRIVRSDPKLIKLCQEYAQLHPVQKIVTGYAATGSKFLVAERKVPSNLAHLTKQYFNRTLAPLLEEQIDGVRMRPNICDMETAVVLRTAHIPAVAIRVISDTYDGDAPAEFSQFIREKVQHYAPLVEYVLQGV